MRRGKQWQRLAAKLKETDATNSQKGAHTLWSPIHTIEKPSAHFFCEIDTSEQGIRTLEESADVP